MSKAFDKDQCLIYNSLKSDMNAAKKINVKYPAVLNRTTLIETGDSLSVNRKTLITVFKLTLPVFAGYLAIGIAFGLMLKAVGYGAVWAFLMSLTVFAGSAQFLGAELLGAGAALTRIALLTLLINFRHVVYGISMLEKFRGMGTKKPYMIFSLTDETYALLSSVAVPDGVAPKTFYFCVAVLNHLYWLFGSVIGSVAGSLISFNTQGVEFAMTALFIVIAVEQWQTRENRLPALIGVGCTIASLLLLGSENMLLPALFVMVTLLLLSRKKLDKTPAPAGKEAGE